MIVYLCTNFIKMSFADKFTTFMEKLSESAGKLKDATVKAYDKSKEIAADVKDKAVDLKDKAVEIKDKTVEAAGDMKEKAGDIKDAVVGKKDNNSVVEETKTDAVEDINTTKEESVSTPEVAKTVEERVHDGDGGEPIIRQRDVLDYQAAPKDMINNEDDAAINMQDEALEEAKTDGVQDNASNKN